MSNEIVLQINHRLRRVLELSGDREWSTGTTTIEARSDSESEGVHFYVQNKGFGKSSSKSVETILDNATVAALSEFFATHLELVKQFEAMRNAGTSKEATP